MNWTRGVALVAGAVLVAGCGAEELAAGEEGELGEAVQVQREQSSVERELTALAYCDDVATWPTAYTDLENQVLTLVNQKRAAGATCGGVYNPPVAALTLDTKLRCAARKHSKDMGDKNFFSHTGSNGSTPWQRITSAGYSYTGAGENIAAGHATALAVVNGWMASTGHCTNIMNGTFKHLGVGYYPRSGSTYTHYWTQDFGKP
ncbi:CAP domain-containing protein [Hyalangium minutum]|uniref:Transporter n=1 Tax=Hyalangium minutum TaxID=394096 RepID=A0A085W8F5_9BACT|nr:CAP domain-containing protein [Hyalangium minutum]KFE63968.1 Transporter [Hyalangium minutum]